MSGELTWGQRLRRTVRYWVYAHMTHRMHLWELARIFRKTYGAPISRENARTFNQKNFWLRACHNLPVKTELADKSRVETFVAARIGPEYLLRTYGVWNHFEEIDFDALPESFVLKATHGCGMNLVVRSRAEFDHAAARKLVRRWLRTNHAYYFLELQYEKIPPRVMAQEFVENIPGNLFDYKIHCFNGRGKFLQYMGDRNHLPIREAFFDRDWNPQPFVFNYEPFQTERLPPRPTQLEKLFELAEKLAAGFAYVRVDFYILNDGSIKFGEMTFSPACDHWRPAEWDERVGAMIELPEPHEKL